MKQQAIQQEILLVLGTSFSARECAEKDSNTTLLSDKERLERACWNGLLHEMLPEIFEEADGDERLYLWRIKTSSNFLELELGQINYYMDAYFSIDPYSFLATESLS
ncbi:MAG: hypothetical protein JST75_21980 [Bacteroidetes bacterium]|nr:hypothetical protein [Bacteroidota bacterium]